MQRPLPQFEIGEEVWIYDLARKERNQLRKLGAKSNRPATILHRVFDPVWKVRLTNGRSRACTWISFANIQDKKIAKGLET